MTAQRATTTMARSNHRLPKIPEMTIRRLSVYTRCLQQLEEDGVKTVSSQELAERFSLNSAQVRKDLAYFGEFGVRGIGYYVVGLKAELQRILGSGACGLCGVRGGAAGHQLLAATAARKSRLGVAGRLGLRHRLHGAPALVGRERPPGYPENCDACEDQ